MNLSLKSRISSRLGHKMIVIDEKSNEDKASIEDRISLGKKMEKISNN
jgi:hypothetical protein